MARKKSTPPRLLSHHWYLREWAEQSDPPKIQADAERELGWAKASASYLWNGTQRYTQDLVDEVAAWLNIRPYELLLPPDEAMLIRRMRGDALRLAHATAISQTPATEQAEPQQPRRRTS